jgi:FkbM family methyltransferase
VSTWSACGGRVCQRPDDSLIEWEALLHALAAARDRFCMIELGAGYGPWLARAAVAWRRRHPDASLLLVGIEAEPAHFQYLGRHLVENGVPESCARLFHAAVSTADGEADFEVSSRPDVDWGARLMDGPQPTGLPRLADVPTIRVPAMSLATIARDLGPVDLLHVDIQGSEVPVLQAAERVLREQVRRLLVGTHGRDIEAQLIEWLVPRGFHLQDEQPCRYRLGAGAPVLVEDGAQFWLNQAHAAQTAHLGRDVSPGADTKGGTSVLPDT